MKPILHTLVLTSALVASSSAATVLALTGDTGNSDSSDYSGSLAGTLGDTFLYNPDSPTSSLPDQIYSSNGDGFHANKSAGLHTLSYTLSGGAFTAAGNTEVYFDFYGRSANTNRDNNYTVTLYNGDYTVGTLVSQQTAQMVEDSSPFYNRTTFNITDTTQFDRIQVTSPAATGDTDQFFTVMEVRAATQTIPEPSSTVLIGFSALSLILRRKRA